MKVLSMHNIKKILQSSEYTTPEDDFKILDSWYDTEEKDSDKNSKLKYMCYKIETMNPSTKEKTILYKAIRFTRVERLPKSAKQSTSFMDMQAQVLSTVYEQGYNLITIIANIIKPVAEGLMYLYGVQGVSDNIDDAKKRADADFHGFIGAMMGTFRVLHLKEITAEEGAWLGEKMRSMKFMTSVRGIPKAPSAGEDAGNKGMGGSNLNPDSQGTLEEIITAMADYEYVIEVLSTPVKNKTLRLWSSQTQKQMTEWYGLLQGTKSLSFNLSIPMTYMTSTGNSQGWSRNYTDSRNISYSHGESYNTGYSESVGNSLSQSLGESFGINKGTSVTNSTGESHSISQGLTKGETVGITEGITQGRTIGQTIGYTQGISHGYSNGISKGVSNGQSLSMTQGNSFGTSSGINQGVSRGVNSGLSTSQNIGSSLNVGHGVSSGINQGNSVSMNRGTSVGRNTGESFNQSFNNGFSQSLSNNKSYSSNVGQSYGESIGSSAGKSLGNSLNSSVSAGANASDSAGASAGHSFGNSQSNSYSSGINASQGNGYSAGASTGLSGSSGYGNSGTHTDSRNQSIGGGAMGVSLGGGRGQSDALGNSANSSLSANMGNTFGVNGSSSVGGSYSESGSESATSSYNLGVSSSHSAGESETYSTGAGKSYSENFGASYGENKGLSFSNGYSESTGNSMGRTYGTSEGYGLTSGRSYGESVGVSQGQTNGVSYGQSQNVSQGQSFGQGFGQTTGSSYGQTAGTSMGQNQGQSISVAVSRNTGTSSSVSATESMSESNSISNSQSDSASESNSFSNSRSQSASVSQSESNGTSTSRSLGESQGESYTQSISNGLGKNWGQSNSIGKGQNYSESEGSSTGTSIGNTGSYTTGTSGSLGLGPSIGYSKSYQWMDQQVKDILELLEYQNERLKKSLRGYGAFYTYVYIACQNMDALATAQAAAKSTWQNQYAMIQPIQVLDLTEEEQQHLLYHFRAFSADVTRERVYGKEDYKYATILLPDEYVAYTHLPRISEGGIDVDVEDIPKFRVPGLLRGQIYMGTQLNAERYTFKNGYRTQFDYRINIDELMHGIFTGQSRSGKTVAAMRFISELANSRRTATGKRLRIVIMDPKQDWRGIARFVEPKRFRFYSLGNTAFRPINMNPCKIPYGVEPQHWIDGIINIYCRAYGLLERGKQMLSDVFYRQYTKAGVFPEKGESFSDEYMAKYPDWKAEISKRSAKVTFHKIYKDMESVQNSFNGSGKKAGNDTLDAYSRLLERLSCFSRPYSIEYRLFSAEDNAAHKDAFDDIDSFGTGYGIDELIGKDDVTVFESFGLESTFANFIFGIITSGFYKVAKGFERGFLNPEQYETVLVIEEANKVLTGNDTAGTGGSDMSLSGQSEFEEILDQSAGYGLFIIAITQKISMMPSSIVANCGLLFMGKISQPEDVDLGVRMIGREGRIDDRDVVKWLPKSPTGWFICRSNRGYDFRDAEPVLVQIEPLNKAEVSNSELDEILAMRDYEIAEDNEKLEESFYEIYTEEKTMDEAYDEIRKAGIEITKTEYRKQYLEYADAIESTGSASA